MCWSQQSFQRFKIYVIIKGLKSVYGIEQLDTGLPNAYLASRSTTMFPWIYIWIGIHVKITCLPIATRLLKISTIYKIKGFWVLQLLIANKQERESEHIMNLLLSEEATNFKATRIALASALKIDLADGNRESKPTVRKQLSMLLYHHLLNHQYIL